MTEKKMENPYHALGEAFVSSAVAGNRGKMTGNQIGLSDRLRQMAYYTQENATEAGDALLVNDLLDAARQLEREGIRTYFASTNRPPLS
jgi:hypothetical protein